MSKYQVIADSLRSQIYNHVYDEPKKFPTEMELCREYDVSRQTIRHALAILAGDGLIERLQGSGSRVLSCSAPVPQQTRSIAVITTYISDYIFPVILRDIEDVLSVNNCIPMLYATQNQVVNERKILLKLLDNPTLNGMLVEGTKTALPNPNLDLYRKLIDRKIPMVFFNANYRELNNAVAVLDDNYAGGYQLVQYLHAKGHTNIAGIFKDDDIQGHQRYAGYTAAILEAGLPLMDSNLFWYSTALKEKIYAGQVDYYADQMIETIRSCSAVLCYNDEIASVLLGALTNRRIRVPEEMAIVSFDNSRLSRIAPIMITSLSHGKTSTGKVAAEMIIRLLAGEVCESEWIPWDLMERKSSQYDVKFAGRKIQ